MSDSKARQGNHVHACSQSVLISHVRGIRACAHSGYCMLGLAQPCNYVSQIALCTATVTAALS
eukprot:14068556-Alexandrium_andersonii.AAC.1